MKRLTRGELEVMRVLWEQGEAKPAEIQERFPRPIKNSALRSYLTILLEKGHVTRRKVGKAYHYGAKTRRQRALRSMLAEMAENFCEGSTRALMAHLIRSEKLSDEELLELRRIAEGEEQGDRGGEGERA